MERDTPRFDRRSAADLLAQAQTFEGLAERFKNNLELSEGFRKLAEDIRQRLSPMDG